MLVSISSVAHQLGLLLLTGFCMPMFVAILSPSSRAGKQKGTQGRGEKECNHSDSPCTTVTINIGSSSSLTFLVMGKAPSPSAPAGRISESVKNNSLQPAVVVLAEHQTFSKLLSFARYQCPATVNASLAYGATRSFASQ